MQHVCDDDTDCSQFSSLMGHKEIWVESEAGPASPLGTAPDSKDANSDGFVSLIDSGETQVDRRKHNSRRDPSPSSYENKSAYTSVVGISIWMIYFLCRYEFVNVEMLC